MPLSKEVIAIAVPRGARVENEKTLLDVSIVFSPMVLLQEATRVEKPAVAPEKFKAECETLANWVEKAGLPWRVEQAVQVYVVPKGWDAVTGTPRLTVKLDEKTPLPVTLDRRRLDSISVGGGKIDESHSTALWKKIFGNCWLLPEQPQPSAQPSQGAMQYGDASNPEELRKILRNDGSTIEGISSGEVNRLVACGMAAEAVQGEKEEIPFSLSYAWEAQLRRLDFAIERRRQLGAAGSTSAALGEEEDSARDAEGATYALGEEFHRRLSMVDDFPDVSRALGLVVDVTITTDLPAQGTEVLLALKLQLPGVEVIRTCATACYLETPNDDHEAASKELLFYAAKAGSSRLLDRARCVDPEQLETVQWDLESGVRSILRKYGFQQQPQQNSSGEQPGATAPSGYGMTVFWKDAKAFINESTADVRTASGPMGKNPRLAKDIVLSADDLVLGYVPAVRRLLANGAGKQVETWRSLTHRALTLNTGDFRFEWSDEMPLTMAGAEAPQPLAGWVLDILHREAKDNGSNQIAEQWFYLISTPTGFVVVKEAVTVKYLGHERPPEIQRSSQKPKKDATPEEREEGASQGAALFDLLPAKARRSSALRYLGQFVEFRGYWERDLKGQQPTGCFLSKDATLRPGVGLAGRLAGRPGFNPLVADGRNYTLITLPIARRQVVELDQTENAEKLHNVGSPSTQAGAPTYVYLRCITRGPINSPLLVGDWRNLYFQGRGAYALAVVETEKQELKPNSALRKAAPPRMGVRLRFEEMQEQNYIFSIDLENADSTTQERMRQVRIARAENADFQLLFTRSDDPKALTPGSVYQVSADASYNPEKKETSILATRIVEVSPDAMADFHDFRREKDHWVAFFTRSQPGDLRCRINPETTRVILHTEGPRARFEDEVNETSAPPIDDNPALKHRMQAQGSWLQMGARIGRGDRCKLHLHPLPPGSDSGGYLLDRVEVMWSDPANVMFAYRNDQGFDPKGDERVFQFEEIATKTRFERRMGEETTILSVPAVLPPEEPWRQWHIPPPGALLRIFQYPLSPYPQRIEVINVLDTFISKWDARTSTVDLNLPVRPDPISFTVTKALGRLFEVWTKPGQELVEKGEGSRKEWKELDLNAFFSKVGEVTVRLGSERKIQSISFVLPGQDISEDGGDFVWTSQQLRMKIPKDLVVKPPATQQPTGFVEVTAKAATKDSVDGKLVLGYRTEELSKPAELVVQIQNARSIAAGMNPDPTESLLSQQAAAFVLAAPPERAELTGTTVPLFVEVAIGGAAGEAAAPDAAATDLRTRYFSLLKAAFDSGFPLSVEAQAALVIDNAAEKSADWDLLRFDAPNGPQINSRIDLVGDLKAFRVGLRIAAGLGPAYLLNPADWIPQTFYIVAQEKSVSQFPEVKIDLGDTKTPQRPRNDQVIADDVLMHFHGWSLAVDPAHRAEQKERIRATQSGPVAPTDRPPELDVRARLARGAVPKPEEALPRLRVGSAYELIFRVMDIAGNVVSVTHPSLYGVKPLHFRPFGSFSDPAEQTLLRFDPIGMPVVWQSSPKPEWNSPEKAAVGGVTGSFVEEVVLLTNRIRPDLLTLPPELMARLKVQEVRLTALPPPAHWHLAETLGDFDRPGVTPEATHARITKRQDWVAAMTGAFDPAHPMPSNLWADSVADPWAEQLLVLSFEKAQSRRVKISPTQPVTLSFRRRVSTPGEPKPVIVQNRPPDEPFEPSELSPVNPGTTSAILDFPEDIDTPIRIFGIPASGDKSGLSRRSFLSAIRSLARAALQPDGYQDGQGDNANKEAPGLLAALRLLQRPFLEGKDPAVVSESDLRLWLAGLRNLIPEEGENNQRLVQLLTHPWVATPRRIRVRHVTNKPYTPPKLVSLQMKPRVIGQMDADFQSVFTIHRPSTGALSLQAALEQEYTDDPRAALPSVPDEELMRILEHPQMREDARVRLLALETRLLVPNPAKDVQVLGRPVDLTTLLGRPPLDVTNIFTRTNRYIPDQGPDDERFDFSQDFQDTRHRTVFYRGVAHSRFGREFFGENCVETNPETQLRIERSNDWMRVEVPATAPPADVEVPDITVLIEWSGGMGQGEELWQGHRDGWQFSRTRRCGHRVWLNRPWYSSGSGEKLAVLLWMDTHVPWQEGQEFARLVSRWAQDPVFEVDLPSDNTEIFPLTRAAFVAPWAAPLGLKSRPMRPNPDAKSDGADQAASVPSEGEAVFNTEDGRMLPVGLAVYSPRFHPDRKLWYADIFIEPKCYMPFVSYSIARYQPCALVECALSNHKRLRMLQPLPVRTLTLKARNTGMIEIDVSLAGIFPPQNRRKISIQVEYNPFLEELAGPAGDRPRDTGNEDLGWEPIPILSSKGVEQWREVVNDPEAGVRSIQTTVRIPSIPYHKSHWADRIGGLGSERDAAPLKGWACRFLRFTITEDEIFPCSHGMLEGQQQAPRRIYSDQILLPQPLLEGARQGTAEERKIAPSPRGIPPSAPSKPYLRPKGHGKLPGARKAADETNQPSSR